MEFTVLLLEKKLKSIKLKGLNMDIFDTMMDNDETWYFTSNGTGMIVSDGSLLDC